MKRSAMIVIIVVVLLGGITFFKPHTVEYSNPAPQVVEKEVEVVEELDPISRAQKELERINLELDAEETNLLEQRAVIDAKLERIAKTRTSF